MHKNRNYDPVGLLLAEEELFGLSLAEVGLLAYSWPKWALERPKSTFRLPVGRKVSGAQNVIKMDSNEKVINMKNLRLVETVDFDIKIILIRARMQRVTPDRPNGCQKICHGTPGALGETV